MRVPWTWAAFLSAAALAAAAGADPQDPGDFFWPDANYVVRMPTGWESVESDNAAYQLALHRDNHWLWFGGLESGDTVFESVQAVDDFYRQTYESLEKVEQKAARIAGARGMTVTWAATRGADSHRIFFTGFTHLGIIYQLLGILDLEKPGTFVRDYYAILASVRFLADRPKWAESHIGTPARTALLGGLVSFELNRPRWRENTFNESRAYHLDYASFSYVDGESWMYAMARKIQGDAAAELEALRLFLECRWTDPVSEPASLRLGSRTIPHLRIRGSWSGSRRVFLAAAFVREGIALHVWAESMEGKLERILDDWEQVLRTVELDSATSPKSPPAFPAERPWRRPQTSSSLAAVLGRATRVLTSPAAQGLLAVSPDGGRALLHSDRQVFVRDLRTGARKALKLDPLPAGSASWARTGDRVAYVSDDGRVVVAPLGGMPPRVLDVRSVHVSFDRDPSQLLLCARVPAEWDSRKPPSSRLERMDLGTGARRVLVDFPLSRVTLAAASPDGRRIALVANRDLPRTAALGGNVYVCAADGSDLRRLTEGPEVVSALAWRPDGKGLLALRQRSVAADGGAGDGGWTDLWTLPADGGPAENLTRSGNIGQAWVAGEDALLSIGRWGLDESQQGLFRIGLAALRESTASRPEPPVWDPRAAARAVAERVRAVLRVPEPRDFVPTAEAMVPVATAFASGVVATRGTALDLRAESLERLPELGAALELGRGADPALLLGFGAYYGETLRHVAGAEWRIRPRRFGDWAPSSGEPASPVARAILPFSDWLRAALGADNVTLLDAEEAERATDGPRLLLVYPPDHAAEAVRDAGGADFDAARRRLDDGEVAEGIAGLSRLLPRSPRNRVLAEEVVSLCARAGQDDLARRLSHEAVEAGASVPDLLVRVADEIAVPEPERALALYRKAAAARWGSAPALVKLGKVYAATGRRPVAESCWRRAYWDSSPEAQREIRQLMGLEPAGK